MQRIIEGDKNLIELSVRVLLAFWRNELTRELQAIREWLHAIPTSLNPAEIRRGYLPYTKNKLKQARRTGAPVPRGLVEELDPDAVLREGAGGSSAGRLAGDDAVSPLSAWTRTKLMIGAGV